MASVSISHVAKADSTKPEVRAVLLDELDLNSTTLRRRLPGRRGQGGRRQSRVLALAERAGVPMADVRERVVELYEKLMPEEHLVKT